MHDLYAPGTDAEASGARARHWQRGQTLVAVAVMLVVLIGFLGLVIDGGNVYAQRRQMQNAADASALAGARVLALDLKKKDKAKGIEEAVKKYAQENGAASWTYKITDENTAVSVDVTKRVATYFVRVLGITSVPVGAHAKAKISPPDDVGCAVLPITVDYDALDPDSRAEGDVFTIWESDPSECDLWTGDPDWGSHDISAEMHGWLSLDPEQDCGNAGSSLACWVCADAAKKECPRYSISVGDWVIGNAGLDDDAVGAIACNVGKPAVVPLYDDMCECHPISDTVTNCKDVIFHGSPLSCIGCQSYFHIKSFASVEIVVVTRTQKCKAFDIQWKNLTTSPECTEGTSPDPTNTWKVTLVE